MNEGLCCETEVSTLFVLAVSSLVNFDSASVNEYTSKALQLKVAT